MQPARARIRLLAFMEGRTVSGPAKNLFEFCRMARELKEGPTIETSLLVFHRHPDGVSDTSPLTQQALEEGLAVHGIPERFAFDRRVMASLKEIVDRVAPDIIQTHMLKSHFLVRACGAHKNRAWVAFHHGYTHSTRRHDLLEQLDRWSLRAPHQVVTVSDAFSRLLVSRGVPSDRIMVLHNAINPDWLGPRLEAQDSSPQEASAIVSRGEKLVLAVGRLSKEKGLPDLVAAMAHLRSIRPDLAVRLVIVGEGLERGTIEETVRRLGLDQQVRLVGHVKDVRPYFRVADLLAISSLSEGSPNVLLEAMAAGVPVVSTEVGGIPEIVSHLDTAFLVPPQDPVSMAKAVDQVLSDRGLAQAMAGRARRLIHTKYSPLSRAQTLVSLYERMSARTFGTQRSESMLSPIATRAV